MLAMLHTAVDQGSVVLALAAAVDGCGMLSKQVMELLCLLPLLRLQHALGLWAVLTKWPKIQPQMRQKATTLIWYSSAEAPRASVLTARGSTVRATSMHTATARPKDTVTLHMFGIGSLLCPMMQWSCVDGMVQRSLLPISGVLKMRLVCW